MGLRGQLTVGWDDELMTEQIELLTGWSSRKIAHILLGLLALVPPVVIASVLLNQLGADPDNAPLKPLFLASEGALFALVALICAGYVALLVRTKKERESGYTLVNDEHVNVALVDYQTGAILRDAFEPRLPHGEYLRRRQLSRASGGSHSTKSAETS